MSGTSTKTRRIILADEKQNLGSARYLANLFFKKLPDQVYEILLLPIDPVTSKRQPHVCLQANEDRVFLCVCQTKKSQCQVMVITPQKRMPTEQFLPLIKGVLGTNNHHGQCQFCPTCQPALRPTPLINLSHRFKYLHQLKIDPKLSQETTETPEVKDMNIIGQDVGTIPEKLRGEITLSPQAHDCYQALLDIRQQQDQDDWQATCLMSPKKELADWAKKHQRHFYPLCQGYNELMALGIIEGFGHGRGFGIKMYAVQSIVAPDKAPDKTPSTQATSVAQNTDHYQAIAQAGKQLLDQLGLKKFSAEKQTDGSITISFTS